MAIKLTEKQLELLIHALKNRIDEVKMIVAPLLTELADHENFLSQYDSGNSFTAINYNVINNFEILPWSKKIVQVLFDSQKMMTTNEIVAEIVNRVPGLAEESSTRSSVASILSRRSGKLFKKRDDKYGLIEWNK
ncbi:MAG: hypothetical protein H7096_01785 [Flavobacterium sp.]|nr:hypothetical protein [Pedobacter sp.]